jgi:DNA-binding protein Fis
MNQSVAEGSQLIKAVVEQKVGLLKNLAQTVLGQAEVLSNNLRLIQAARCINLYEALRTLEIELIRHALIQTRGHQREAAELLGLNATTLNSKIKRYGIKWSDAKGAALSTLTPDAVQK